MNPRRTSRRLISALAAVAAGIVGALVVASPASAHHPEVSGVAACDRTTGNWIVTWTIRNSEDDLAGEITQLKSSQGGADKTLNGVAVGDILPADSPPGTGVVVGTEIITTVPADGTADLWVKARWERWDWRKQEFKIIHEGRSGEAEIEGDCTPDRPAPDAEMASDCAGVTVVLTNAGTAPASFVVTGNDGFSESKTVAVGDQDGETVFVPKANATAVTVKVGDQTVATGAWEDPGNCNTPVVEGASSCTEFIARVINPADGPTSVTGSFKPSSGDPTPFTVGQGATGEQNYPGTAGLSVLVDFDGSLTDATVTWEPDPEECTPPTTTNPPLADTGTGGLTEIVAAGTALVLAGAGLLTVLFLRRRRTTAAR